MASLLVAIKFTCAWNPCPAAGGSVELSRGRPEYAPLSLAEQPEGAIYSDGEPGSAEWREAWLAVQYEVLVYEVCIPELGAADTL